VLPCSLNASFFILLAPTVFGNDKKTGCIFCKPLFYAFKLKFMLFKHNIMCYNLRDEVFPEILDALFIMKKEGNVHAQKEN